MRINVNAREIAHTWLGCMFVGGSQLQGHDVDLLLTFAFKVRFADNAVLRDRHLPISSRLDPCFHHPIGTVCQASLHSMNVEFCRLLRPVVEYAHSMGVAIGNAMQQYWTLACYPQIAPRDGWAWRVLRKTPHGLAHRALGISTGRILSIGYFPILFFLGLLRLHDESLRNPRYLLRYHLPTRGPVLGPQGQSAGPCARTKVQDAVQSRAPIGARLCCRGPGAA